MSLDKKTITDFLNNDEIAIGKVFQEYKNLLYFIIATYVSNPDDCDDLLSETFIKALEHKNELKDYKKIKAFLSTIAKNEALNFLKKKREFACSDVIEEMYGESDKNNVLLDILEPLLSSKETIVVYYRAVFSYSWKEISSETGIPESSARKLYSEAKEKLRKEML